MFFHSCNNNCIIICFLKENPLPYKKKKKIIDGHSIFYLILKKNSLVMFHESQCFNLWPLKNCKLYKSMYIDFSQSSSTIGSTLFCHYTSITPKHNIHDCSTSTRLVTYVISHHLCHVYSHNLIMDAMF